MPTQLAGASGSVSFETFRQIMGSFPTGVAVVTTLDVGAPRGATVNALASVSANPPILLICLGRQSRTLAAILRHEAFVVHVLDENAAELSRRFASGAASFHGLAWAPSKVGRGSPVLRDNVVSTAECLVTEAASVGDHTIVFGLVANGRGSADDTPLLYHRGSYHDWRPNGGGAAPRDILAASMTGPTRGTG